MKTVTSANFISIEDIIENSQNCGSFLDLYIRSNLNESGISFDEFMNSMREIAPKEIIENMTHDSYSASASIKFGGPFVTINSPEVSF